jgi:hypothetical protein
MLPEFTKTRFIMCEGDDDKGFLEALIEDRRLPEFQICQVSECNDAGNDGKGVGGSSGFKFSLTGLTPIKGFNNVKALLIVTDNDASTSFRDVQNAFTVNGHTAPVTPTSVGTIYDRPSAVLMVPSSTSYGDLEVLCLPEIYRKWPRSQECVAKFMACTGASSWTKQGSINKARLRAASVGFHEADPYKGLGHLFRSGVLDVHNQCFDEIADFLQNFDAFVGI